MKPVFRTVAGNPVNQDRGLVLLEGSRVVLCVSDGAGGSGGGAEAAAMTEEWIRQNASQLIDANSCAEMLRKMDTAIANDQVAGETTCALTVLTSEEIFGASTGDSGVWLIPELGPHMDLTQPQERKPLLGSGNAWPVPFRCPRQIGRLLLATDGLLKYASVDRILTMCKEPQIELAADRLVESVRYPSGALPDDVTLILSEL